MLYFATYFDKNYLSRGLTLYNSMREHIDNFMLFVLALDDEVVNYFENKKTNNITTIKLKDVETKYPELTKAKNNRTLIEYYFTLSPYLPLYILNIYKTPHICTIDADIKFYSSPLSIFSSLNNFSIIITPHKFSPENKHRKIYGKYNVSFQIFKNDNTGNKCLNLWKKQCFAWCKDKLDEENKRFADQKYLDNWKNLFAPNIKILNDNISGLAVWNINNYSIEKKNNTFFSNNEKIIFYHFHSFHFINKFIALNGFYAYKANCYKALTNLYINYWLDLISVSKNLNLNLKNIRNNYSEPLSKILLQHKSIFIKFAHSFFCSKNINRRKNFFMKKIILLISHIHSVSCKIFLN